MRDGYKTLNILRLVLGVPILTVVVVAQIFRISRHDDVVGQANVAIATVLLIVFFGAVIIGAMVGPALLLKLKLAKQRASSLVFITRGKPELQDQLATLGVPRRNPTERLSAYFVAATSDLGLEFWSTHDSESVFSVIAWGNIENAEVASMRLYGAFEVPCMALHVNLDASGVIFLIPSGDGLGLNPTGLSGIQSLADQINSERKRVRS